MRPYQTIILSLVAVLLITIVLVAIQDHSISDITVKLDGQNRVFLFEMKRQENLPLLN